MATVGESVERAFRALLKEREFQAITVTDICERAHVSRKAFYGVFRDKEDIVRFVFERDVMGTMHHIRAIFTADESKDMSHVIQRKLYQRILDDRDFYRSIVSRTSCQDDVFFRAASSVIYQFNQESFLRFESGLDEMHRDYICYYYAYSQALFMQKWIRDDFAMPLDDFASLFVEMSLKFWSSFA